MYFWASPYCSCPRRSSFSSIRVGQIVQPPLCNTNLGQGLAILVDDHIAHHDPSTSELAKWDSERLRGVEAQLALVEEHDAREALHPDRALSETAILKRKEREERKARHKAGPLDERVSLPPNTESAPEPADASRTTVPRNSTAPYTVHVPGASSTFDWYAPSAHSFTTLVAAREAGIWDYPESPLQHARCAVFRDLWERGYFMGSGIKFGGEYLVYPGMFVRCRKKKKRMDTRFFFVFPSHACPV